MHLCSLWGAASPLLLEVGFTCCSAQGCAAATPGPAWVLNCLQASFPPCVQSCLSHAGWWRGMHLSWGSSSKEPAGSQPLSGVLDLANVMTCTEGSVSREKSLSWSHLFRLPAPVLLGIMEINPLPASLCPVSPTRSWVTAAFCGCGTAMWVRIVASTKR